MRLIRTLQNLTLSIIALLVSLGVCELMVRRLVPVRNVGPSFTLYDPFYGKRLKKSFSTWRGTPEFTMRMTTNAAGFRGPELGALALRPLLFLGDSFTMGYGVNDGEEFPALVRNALSPNPTPVINAGMGDNGNGWWVKFLRSEGKKYHPALVVLQLHRTDFYDNIHERLFTVTPTGALQELPVPRQTVKRALQWPVENLPGLAHSYLVGLARQMSWRGGAPREDAAGQSTRSERAVQQNQLLFRLLEEVFAICEQSGWRVLTVLADIPDDRRAAVETLLSTKAIPTVVIPSKGERPDLYYTVDGHWNSAGHRFTAERILEKVIGADLKYW
jgi:hypothetical protein